MNRFNLFLGTALLGCLWIPFVQGAEDKQVTAVYITSRMVVDGNLDEPDWSLAQPATDFIQKDPREGEPATERTEVRFLYDNENLYIGVYCFDSEGPNGIRVNDLRRDFQPTQTDLFSMILDTFDDNRNGFVFATHPQGAYRDGQASADGKNFSNYDWDAVWYVRTRITELGWQAEISIPFKSLRFRDTEHQVWGVNFTRRIMRKNEVAYWSEIPVPYRLTRVSLAGELNGIRELRPGRNAYVKPYVSTPVVRREGDDTDFLPEAGLDIKYSITPGLTLDLTANTDFAQVEADEQQINLTRFSLFFPEKREFFLENAGIFEFGGAGRDLIPFFSRRIGISGGKRVPILGGGRLSGTAGPFRVGALSLQTDGFEDTASTNFSVVRIRRDLLVSSDVGVLLINKQVSGGEFNRTYGVDTNLRFWNYLDLSSVLLKTDTPGVSDRDKAGDVRVSWSDRLVDIRSSFLSIQEDFNPEVGFVRRRGIRKSVGEFAVRPRPGERMPGILQIRPFASIDYITDQENVLETRISNQGISVTFDDGHVLSFTRRVRFERLEEDFEIQDDQFIPAGDHQFTDYSTSFTSDRSRLFGGNASLTTGGFWDGDKDTYRLGFRLQPGYQFGAELSWSYDDVALPSGDFTTSLVTTRCRYSFTPDMFLNALIQYNSESRQISSNVRFNLTYKPLSDLFLVYNERRTTTGEVTERAFIAKLTYVLDF